MVKEYTDFQKKDENGQYSITKTITDLNGRPVKLKENDGLQRVHDENIQKPEPEEKAPSSFEKLEAMIHGLKNDTDGSFAAKLLADNPHVVEKFEARVQAEQEKLQAEQVKQILEEQQETVRSQSRGFGMGR